MSLFKTTPFLLLLALLSGCIINTQSIPLQAGLEIEKIYIIRNYNTKLDPVLMMIENKLQEKGIEYEIVSGIRPDQEYRLEYGGSFSWDLKSYLSKFTISIFHKERLIAGGEYDAKAGGLNLNKFASTSDKVQPVIDECFSNI